MICCVQHSIYCTCTFEVIVHPKFVNFTFFFININMYMNSCMMSTTCTLYMYLYMYCLNFNRQNFHWMWNFQEYWEIIKPLSRQAIWVWALYGYAIITSILNYFHWTQQKNILDQQKYWQTLVAVWQTFSKLTVHVKFTINHLLSQVIKCTLYMV